MSRSNCTGGNEIERLDSATVSTAASSNREGRSPVRGRRSKTGCQNCRRRKVRCDEQKPACQACCRLLMDCVYGPPATFGRKPKYNIRFAEPASHQQQTQEEDERPSMGSELQASTGQMPSYLSMDDQTSNVALLQPGLAAMHFSEGDMTTPGTIMNRFADPWGLMDLTGDPEFELHSPPSAVQTEVATNPSPPRNIEAADSDVGPSITILAPNTPQRRFMDQPDEVAQASQDAVEISPADREPLHHYLNTMTKFSKLRKSRHDNVYTTIFSTLALSHQQLFHAMMAWSSLHLAQTQNRSTLDAEERHSRAIGLLLKDPHPWQHLDVTMVTIWFLLQYELLRADGIDQFCTLLAHASDLLQRLFSQCNSEQAISCLGPLGVRTIVWMSAFDARAALFGKAGRLLGCLRGCSYIYDLLDKAACEQDSGTSESHYSIAQPPPYASSLRLAVRLRMVMGQVKLLKFWQETQTDQQQGWAAVDSSLRLLRAELIEKRNSVSIAVMGVADGSLSAMPNVSTDHYNRMMLLATFYTAVMLYQNYRPAPTSMPVDEFPPASDCALRVIRLANRANTARPDSPQAIWPHLTFHAAINCPDPVYQSWTVRAFRGAEIWGNNLYKTRVLLETILDRQNRSGTSEDLLSVMKEISAAFII